MPSPSQDSLTLPEKASVKKVRAKLNELSNTPMKYSSLVGSNICPTPSILAKMESYITQLESHSKVGLGKRYRKIYQDIKTLFENTHDALKPLIAKQSLSKTELDEAHYCLEQANTLYSLKQEIDDLIVASQQKSHRSGQASPVPVQRILVFPSPAAASSTSLTTNSTSSANTLSILPASDPTQRDASEERKSSGLSPALIPLPPTPPPLTDCPPVRASNAILPQFKKKSLGSEEGSLESELEKFNALKNDLDDLILITKEDKQTSLLDLRRQFDALQNQFATTTQIAEKNIAEPNRSALMTALTRHRRASLRSVAANRDNMSGSTVETSVGRRSSAPNAISAPTTNLVTTAFNGAAGIVARRLAIDGTPSPATSAAKGTPSSGWSTKSKSDDDDDN